MVRVNGRRRNATASLSCSAGGLAMHASNQQRMNGREGTEMTDEEAFDVFWKHYPKKVAKGDARKAWKQTQAIRPDLADVLAAIGRAKATEQWRRDDGQFVPYPATWLRAERWDDVYEVEMEQVDDWHKTASGIYAKADELGVGYSREEPVPFVRQRVEAALEKRARPALMLVAA